MVSADAKARQQLLDSLAEAIDDLAPALASLGAAYEQLDDRQADRLEEELFRPVQRAYGRGKRTHAQFAARHGLPGRDFEMRSPGVASTGVKGFIEVAVEAVGRAEAELAGLQDSLTPIEYGDTDLRAGLSEVREMIGGFSQRARGVVSTYGR
jgi:hypothetical protein